MNTIIIKKQIPQRAFASACIASQVFLTLLVAFSAFELCCWPSFLVAQFRIWLLPVQFVILICVVSQRSTTLAIIAVCTLLANLIFIDRMPAGSTSSVLSASPFRLRVLQLNLEYTNLDTANAEKLIHETDPDIIVCEELTQFWYNNLQTALKPYHGRYLEVRDDPYGNGIFSKYKLTSSRTWYSLLRNHPFLRVNVCDSSGSPRFSLLHAHLQGPVSPRNFEVQKDDALTLKEATKESLPDLVICGDMNSSSCCAPLKLVTRKMNLRDILQPYQFTWPTRKRGLIPFLQLDHFLVSQQFKVLKCEVGRFFGSDHLPIICDIQLDK